MPPLLSADPLYMAKANILTKEKKIWSETFCTFYCGNAGAIHPYSAIVTAGLQSIVDLRNNISLGAV